MTPRVALLHGFSGHADAWTGVTAALAPTRCLAIHLLGHDAHVAVGTTDTFESEVHRIAALLGDSAAAWHVCGYSMGARLALGLLVAHPKLVASATLIGVHPGLTSHEERAARRVTDGRWIDLLLHEGIERFADAWQDQPLFASQGRLPPSVLRAQHARRLRHDPRKLAHALAVLGLGHMPDFLPDLPRVSCPLTLLVGAEDTRFVAQAERMREHLPRAHVEIVPGAGHNLVLERPLAVIAAINKGLTS
jgi:2-succinyl-6-hydroxy-2,4-cyclohexadiene-1-carboxylate synthase